MSNEEREAYGVPSKDQETIRKLNNQVTTLSRIHIEKLDELRAANKALGFADLIIGYARHTEGCVSANKRRYAKSCICGFGPSLDAYYEARGKK